MPYVSQHSTAVALELIGALATWHPQSPPQSELRDEYIAFVTAGGAASLDRDGGAEHVTASCFILSPGLDRVMLCFHKKGQFWVQMGGHIEASDSSVAAGALREAREERGVVDLIALGGGMLLDLDRHALSSTFGSCRVHWDVGFGAIAPDDVEIAVSDESEDVAWWPVDALPLNVPTGFGDRLAGVLRELAAQTL